MRVSVKRNFKADQISVTLERDDGTQLAVELKKHEIRLVKSLSSKGVSIKGLAEEERLALFRVILAEYREHSFGDGGYKGAAIGVTEDDRIFIGLNTKRQHPYFKDCAEQNMLNAVTDAISFTSMKEDRRLPDSPPKLREMYLMGGAEPTATKAGLKISCPCGKCVDMLSRAMTSETSPIYVMPIPDEPLRDVTEDPFPYGIKTAKDAATVNEIDPDTHIWKVPISYLDRNRVISISATAAAHYVDGVKTLMGRLQDDQPELPFDEEAAAKLAMRLVKDADASCKTIHDLNHVGRMANGENSLKQINQFMRGRVDEAMESRWRSYHTQHPQATQEAFLHDVDAVRCVVIQLQDGSFRYGMEVDSAMDNAAPNAEVNAAMNATEVLSEHKIRNVWVMEIRPSDVEKLEAKQQKPTMHTSPKEGIERIVKRGANDLMFHYIPYNDGTRKGAELSEEQLRDMTSSFRTHEIFPSNFKGIKLPNSAGDGRAGGVG